MRWKLTEPHYLNVPETTWEQKETDRMTGKQVRKAYPVPLYLNPKEESDWNYQSIDGGDGGIIVAWKGKGQPRDIIFEGPPTPGMEPLDGEAKAESGKYKWTDPINDFDHGITYSERLLMDLQGQVAEAISMGGLSRKAEGGGEMKEALTMLTQLMAQNTQLLQQLASQGTARRL